MCGMLVLRNQRDLPGNILIAGRAVYANHQSQTGSWSIMQTTQNKKLITSPSGMATTEGRKQNKTKQIQRLKKATQRQAIRTDSETRLENPAVVRIFFSSPPYTRSDNNWFLVVVYSHSLFSSPSYSSTSLIPTPSSSLCPPVAFLPSRPKAWPVFRRSRGLCYTNSSSSSHDSLRSCLPCVYVCATLEKTCRHLVVLCPTSTTSSAPHISPSQIYFFFPDSFPARERP